MKKLRKEEGSTAAKSFFSELVTFFSQKRINKLPLKTEELETQHVHSEKKIKKCFSNLLTDYPTTSASSVLTNLSCQSLRANNSTNESKKEIIRRLRHRLDLGISMDDGGAKEEDDENRKNGAIEMSKVSLYDTLLELIDDYDGSGINEIFQLLIESRFTVPLFSPLTFEHYLTLMNEVYVPVVPNKAPLCLGMDTELKRIVLVSCRNRGETQALELLKTMFNVDTFHRNDLFDDSLTKVPLAIDLGIGCIKFKTRKTAVSKSISETEQHVLVVHMIGKFQEAIKFINCFADVLLVEDSFEKSAFRSLLLMSKEKRKPLETDKIVLSERLQVLLWIPTTGKFVLSNPEENMKEHGFRHSSIQAQYGDVLVNKMSLMLQELLYGNDVNHNNRLVCLSETVLRTKEKDSREFFDVAGIEVFHKIDKIKEMFLENLPESRRSLKLQINFRQQGQLEEEKRVNSLNNDKHSEMAIDARINECMKSRRHLLVQVRDNKLIRYFLTLLRTSNRCIRGPGLLYFAKGLTQLTDEELGKLQSEINDCYSILNNFSWRLSNENNEEFRHSREEYVKLKSKYQESILHIEHLWRELSHMYVASPGEFQDFPKLAAQHLMDGFPIELLDGDANLLNLPWLNSVFVGLQLLMDESKNRIFVLSVMGIQSSGKSTLLNTMFGVRMKTSVGQCTRGINMQLIPVEGRKEYDYVLILDTEGMRSPAFYGMPGNEKRDNQMATLSILLADATIVVNPGENDAAVKEILPIVLLAYEGSKLAEERGGRMSSMMFFVYNRIDTTQKEKLKNVIQSLATSLWDAFTLVSEMSGYVGRTKEGNNTSSVISSLFRHFRLDASNSKESDVRILGQNKRSFNPPDNAPDPTYGASLVEFREHIHARVTQQSKDRPPWKGQSPVQLSVLLNDIWACICSTDFNMRFGHIIERKSFDLFETDYLNIQRELASEYYKLLVTIRNKFIQESTIVKTLLDKETEKMYLKGKEEFEKRMRDITSQLDKKYDSITRIKGREKWLHFYQSRWNHFKSKQQNDWHTQFELSYKLIFFQDDQVEVLNEAMRKHIMDSIIPDVGKSEVRNNLRTTTFDILLNEFLESVTKKPFFSVDIDSSVKTTYKKSITITQHGISLPTMQEFENECKTLLSSSSNKLSGLRTNELSYLVFKQFAHLWEIKQSRLEENLQDTSSAKAVCMSTEVKNKLLQCLINIQDEVLDLLRDLECYNEGIVHEVIEKTESALQEMGFEKIEYSYRQLVHTFARVFLVTQMNHIQEKWEQSSTILGRFKELDNIKELHEFYRFAAEGGGIVQLFGYLIKRKFDVHLSEAFEAEIVARVVEFTKQHGRLNSYQSLRKMMELYLLELVENNQFPEIIRYINNPDELFSFILDGFVSESVNKIAFQTDGWSSYLDIVKESIAHATNCALGVQQNRAQIYLDAIRSKLIEALKTDKLGGRFRIPVADNYRQLDEENEQTFRQVCQHELFEDLNSHSDPRLEKEFVQRVTVSVIERLRSDRVPGVMPRCEHRCPWCGSPCIYEADHDPKELKHDAIHQPAGLVGRSYLNSLDSRTCSNADGNSLLYDPAAIEDSSISQKLFRFSDWCERFPEWNNPRPNQECPPREYIFFQYGNEISRYYQLTPSNCVPEVYNRDLNAIKNGLLYNEEI